LHLRRGEIMVGPMTQTPIIDTDALKALVLKTLDDNKATDVVDIDLRGKSTVADFMVVASGTSSRQVASLAQKIMDETAKEFPGIPQRIEGKAEADWVLVDLNDIIVHIFRPEVRDFYALEKMWAMTSPSTAHRKMMTKKTSEAL
jgi:ribosome-associated protein